MSEFPRLTASAEDFRAPRNQYRLISWTTIDGKYVDFVVECEFDTLAAAELAAKAKAEGTTGAAVYDDVAKTVFIRHPPALQSKANLRKPVSVTKLAGLDAPKPSFRRARRKK